MSPEFKEVWRLQRSIDDTFLEINALELLIEHYKEARVLEFWDDSNITFFKEDLQALLDSKNKRAERIMDKIRGILAGTEGDDDNSGSGTDNS